MADIDQLWQATFDADNLDGFEPGATYKPPAGTLVPALIEVALSAPSPQPEEAYEVIGEIGRGGMGVVYRARQTRLDREVALKSALQNDAGHRSKFVAEARVTAILDHPNIVPVHDLVPSGAGVAMAMKLVEGTPWNRLLHPMTELERIHAFTLDPEDHLDFLISVCHAVAFAHNRGFVHCDLKPENVMIGNFGEVVVMDWGCSLDLGARTDDERITQEASTIRRPFGTPAYMAPELALGLGESIGPWTDVYLLGAMLYEILCGKPPHVGKNFGEVLRRAAGGHPPDFPPDVPDMLVEVVRTAMNPDPEARYQEVSIFQAALSEYLEARASLQISRRASAVLERCEQRLSSISSADDRNALYIDLHEAVAGFAQAEMMWSRNAEARAGQEHTRRLITETALANGDLGLAQANAVRLPESDAGLQARVEMAVAERQRERRTARYVRVGLVASLATIALVSAVGLWIVMAERTIAQDSLALAEERLGEIRRLADVKRLLDQEQQADDLWPALPDKVAALTLWLQRSDELIGRLPQHEQQLSALVASGLDTDEARWEAHTLEELVAGLQRLRDVLLPDVTARHAFAKSVRKHSIDDRRAEWDAAIAAVASSPQYAGLPIKAQLGLVPLGADPDTGLQEFVHLASGDVPSRGPNGHLAPTQGMGIVFVLIPGGSFHMGAVPGKGADNLDPSAKDIEGPVHAVTLGPFFLSKYEMTQDQWTRLSGANPAAYRPGEVKGDKVHTLMHPVEQVRWAESIELLGRVDLTLPTEAQWEYGARAGTRTVFWTGDPPQSLQGAANLGDVYARDNGGPGSWHYEPFLNDGYVVHSPVGLFRANAFGLHDTAGNVWEWCADRFGAYTLATAPVDGARQAPADGPQVFRGGGFRASVEHARSADRYSLYAAEYRAYDVGLRPARRLDP